MSHVTSGGVAEAPTAETTLQGTPPLVFLPVLHPTRAQNVEHIPSSAPITVAAEQEQQLGLPPSEHLLFSFRTKTQLSFEESPRRWKLSPLQVSGRSRWLQQSLAATVPPLGWGTKGTTGPAWAPLQKGRCWLWELSTAAVFAGKLRADVGISNVSHGVVNPPQVLIII